MKMLDPKKYGFKKILFGYLLIIVLTLIVVLCSIITFTFTIAPRFKGMTSVFIFSIILILYVGVYIYVLIKTRKYYDRLPDKNKFKVDVSKQTLMYISILLIIFFIFLLSLRFPLQNQGVNDIPLTVKIQAFLTNDSVEFYNQTILLEANKVYNLYNISVELEEPIILNFSFNDSEQKLIFGQNCTFIDEIYEKVNITKDVKLLMIFSNNSIDGMGHFCGKGDFIIMSANSTMHGWVLAHELGHVLSAKIECWRYNLMKEYSRECYGANWITHDFIRDLQPTYLNQDQVNAIVESIKRSFPQQNLTSL